MSQHSSTSQDSNASLQNSKSAEEDPKNCSITRNSNSENEEDPWNVEWGAEKNQFEWKEMNIKQKCWIVTFGILRFAMVWALMFIFIISLDMLGNGFKILGGTTAGQVFQNSSLFNNPIAGLVIGILATVLVQSSSTSTSIMITMTAAEIMTVDQAVYMIMGANIGTSVTSTIIALGQVDNREEFRRGFAGATVHDMFNFLSVLVLLPVEYATKMLRSMAISAVNNMHLDATGNYEQTNFLKVITKPVTSRIISVNKGLIKDIGATTNATELEELLKESMVSWSKCDDPKKTFVYCSNRDWSDSAVGFSLLAWALILLCVTLPLVVKILQYSLKGKLAKVLHKAMNVEISPPFAFLSDYLLVVAGIVVTILVQSSSITTSTLTPLVGLGLLKLDKMFPVTVGANVGTTATGLMAALAGSKVSIGLTLAFCHLFFNLFGIILWFIVPFMRQIPINLSKIMGNTTAKYRWFAVAYILIAFIIIPLILLGLAQAGPAVFLGVLIPLLLIIIAYVVVMLLRNKRPEILPGWLKEFYWLPLWMRTEPACLAKYHNGLEAKAAAKEMKSKEKQKEKRESWNTKFLNYLGDNEPPKSEPESAELSTYTA